MLLSMAASSDQTSAKSNVVIEQALLWTLIPTVSKKVTDIVCCQEDHQNKSYLEEFDRLRVLDEVIQLRARVNAWKVKNNPASFLDPIQQLPELSLPKTIEVLSGFLCAVCVVNRLQIALQPSLALVPLRELANHSLAIVNMKQATTMEAEAVDCAKRFIQLYGLADSVSSNTDFFCYQKAFIAEAVISTSAAWTAAAQAQVYDQLSSSRREPSTIGRSVFQHWCSLMGRETS